MVSRSTSREIARGVAYQKQLRDRFQIEGVPPVPHLDLARAEIRPVSRRLAEQVILKYEWLGTMSGTSHHYGIFFGDWCAGVCCVGARAVGAPNNHRPFKVKPDQIAVLARGACVHWAPAGANSKLVSWTCRLLHRDEPHLKVMIAYSDSDAGEIGTIYQACNWTYIGRTAQSPQLVSPTGKLYHNKLLYDLCRQAGYHSHKPTAQARGFLLRAGWTEQPDNPKHKYVYVLDRNDRALMMRVEFMRLPYPKRAESIDADASVHQTEEGGSTPTSALHQQQRNDNHERRRQHRPTGDRR